MSRGHENRVEVTTIWSLTMIRKAFRREMETKLVEIGGKLFIRVVKITGSENIFNFLWSLLNKYFKSLHLSFSLW